MSRRASLSFLVIVLIPILSMLYSRFMATSTPKLSASTATPARTAIIIGSGLAGLSAASELVARNVAVHMLERAPKPGGNSMKASSGINGAPTKYQPIPDDNAFHADTVKSAGVALSASARDIRLELISTLTNSSSAAISWLVDDQGVDLSLVAQLGGHSFPRTHRPAGKLPVGVSMVTTLLEKLKSNPLFQLSTSCQVTKLLQDATNDVNSVTGVEYSCTAGEDGKSETQLLHGPVVIASGGFAGDANGMLATYRPDLAGFPSTNDPRPGSQGLLTAVGAKLLDMDLIQIHPTGFVDPKDVSNPQKILAAEVLRGEGGIMLLGEKRFVNELETRKHVTEAIIAHKPAEGESAKQWDVQLVLDEGTFAAAKSHLDFYVWKGLMRKATVADLSAAAAKAISQYASVVGGKSADPFGRKAFGHWTLADVTPESVIYVGRVTPVVHFTMGGALINTNSEVLAENERPIKGVWGAGEITGGIHGDNRLGGSSLLECVVYGRIAGQQAAAAFLQG